MPSSSHTFAGRSVKKVRMLMPYYGKFPSYFPLFLESCRYNENAAIEFYFFTDLQAPPDLPANVTFQRMSLEELTALARQATAVDIPLMKNPYKLCDLKPMYGDIFSKYLTGCDFWGCGDIDVIYGNISNFITPAVLRTYDIVSVRKPWLSGAFTLFKNTAEINTLYKRSISYRSILMDAKYQGFDECCDVPFKKLMAGESLWELDKKESMSLIVKKAVQAGELTALFEDVVCEHSFYKNEYAVWDSGVLCDSSGREYFLHHFVNAKNSDAFSFPKWQTIPGKFYITATGLYSEKEFKMPAYNFKVCWRLSLGFLKRVSRLLKRIFQK